MNKYYVSKGEGYDGPYTIEELKSLGTGPEDLVWFQGIDRWRKASELAELRVIWQEENEINSISLPDPIQKMRRLKNLIKMRINGQPA
ncbi:MAG: DUF4339 domain-containing protein [Bacteroidetes bacterium]|jgi:GYF domain 2|nr:MAG: DUF4339 domain-containing protein [Bacteroidota bacterium]